MSALTTSEALAVYKAILRRHPFFRSGGMFGFDWNTFRMCYPADAAVTYALALRLTRDGAK